MPPICVPSPRRLNNQASNRKTSRGRIYNILWNQPERRTRCYPPPCPSARSLWLRRARISQSFFEPTDLGPRCRNSRWAAWAHNRTSSSHSSLVGPHARPSQRPQSACSHLQTGASGAEGRRWVDHDHREKRLPRPTRLELEREVFPSLSALVLALV